MATQKIYNTYEHIVTPTSKNVVLEYNGDSSVYFGITVDISGKNATKYSSYYENVSVKSGDDLIVKTIFISNSGSAKTVTTTVKDYFTNQYFDNNLVLESNLLKKQKHTINKETDLGTNGLYWEKGDFSSSDFILAPKYDYEESFKLNDIRDDFVYDEKGKDNYVITSSSGKDYFLEMAGNDKYSASNASSPDIKDLKGNDEYVAENNNTLMLIEDYSGNDKYEAKDSATIKTYDYKGNDEYIAQDNGSIQINDNKGNDKYWLWSHSASGIVDFEGNDSYDLLNAVMEEDAKLRISDYKGNDKFSIKNSSNIDIIKSSGADKYEILNGSNAVSLNDYSGNDGYTVAGGSNNLELTDVAGNDKYTLNDSNYVEISDTKGSDSYKLIGTETNKVSNTTISDELGNDKYVLEHINPERKGDSNNKSSILDQNGNDSYSLKETWDLTITDDLGNDKYTLTGGNINLEINDDSGKDSYISKGTTNLCCAYIVDNGADTDIYNLNGYNTGYISDEGGNNKFTIKNSAELDIYATGEGNDTYTIKYLEWLNINDALGDDKYNITTTYEWDISDSQGADKYTIKELYNTNFTIDDKGSENDTYNFDRVMGKLSFNTSDLENQIYHIKDEDGNDKYNIKNSSMISILDKNGNDSYSIDLTKTEGAKYYIEDWGSDDRDILTIKGLSTKNIMYLSDYDKEGNCSGDMIIFDKSTQSYIQIDSFFNYSTEFNVFEGDFETGQIETIKAGGKVLDIDAMEMSTYLDNISIAVASWLSNNYYDNICEFLNEGSKDDIANFVAYMTEQ